ncbi:MAG: ABC transporter substrate-binding protein [Methanoregula sp.]|nr:ABC transporter substrate-binding protein [Methanoregula sp.]
MAQERPDDTAVYPCAGNNREDKYQRIEQIQQRSMQRLTPARWLIILVGILVSLSVLLNYSTVHRFVQPVEENPSVYLLYASTGSMGQLLNTKQIDAFLIWEPVVSNAELSGIGKCIAVPSDLPPPGKWNDQAINVLVLRNDFIKNNPNTSALFSALTTAAINRTREDPALAENITAAWVYGKNPILTPVGSLQPLDVEKHAFANIVFTANADPPVSGIVQSIIVKTPDSTYNPLSMMDPAVARRGEQYLTNASVPVADPGVPGLGIGYNPSTDNYAPLYVMVKDSAYFCNRYGFCVVPDDLETSRPVSCTLSVRGETFAHVNLIPGQSGGGIMTTIGQNALDGAFVGSVPAEQQIGLGNPASIIQSINTGGSGLVVGNSAPCNNWTGFVKWVKVRSATGSPVVIATVQSSIQEDMVREAFAYENISVKFYGTDFKAAYP